LRQAPPGLSPHRCARRPVVAVVKPAWLGLQRSDLPGSQRLFLVPLAAAGPGRVGLVVSMQLGRAGGHRPYPRRTPPFVARKRASPSTGVRRSPSTSSSRLGSVSETLLPNKGRPRECRACLPMNCDDTRHAQQSALGRARRKEHMGCRRPATTRLETLRSQVAKARRKAKLIRGGVQMGCKLAPWNAPPRQCTD